MTHRKWDVEWLEHRGARIRYGWMRSEGDRGIAILLPGRTEFLEKYEETGEDLANLGFDVLCLDWRGQGLSSRALRNRHKGHIDSYDTYVSDLEALLEHTEVSASTAQKVIVAHSMAGLTALLFCDKNPELVDRVVATGPLWGIPPKVPDFLMLLGATAVVAIGLGRRYVSAGDYGPHSVVFDTNIVTQDRQRWQRADDYVEANPQLALGGFTWGWLRASLSGMRKVSKVARRTRTPWLVLRAGADKVIDNDRVNAVAAQMRNALVHTIPGAEHEMFMETDEIRAQLWTAVDAFCP
jgi:lysophospholipase